MWSSKGDDCEFETEVVICGGGLSGIRAGLLLAQKGVRVIVLEAKNRLGGRTETISYKDSWDVRNQNKYAFDLGAQWIATPELQPRINALADEFKLKRKAQYTEGKGVLHFKGKIDHYSGEVSEVRDGFHKYDDLIHEMNELSKRFETLDVMKETPEKEKLKQELSKHQTPEHWLSHHCTTEKEQNTKSVIEGSIRCLLTTEAWEIDWSWYLWWLNSGKGYGTHSDTKGAAQHEVLEGGSQQLSEIMADKIKSIFYNNRILLSSAVTAIKQDNEKVIVSFIDLSDPNKLTKHVKARYIIVAVPPPLASRIVYDPPLPLNRELISSRMRMGSIIKCFVIYSKPFWRSKGLSGETFTDQSPVTNYYDATSEDGKVAAIVGLIGGKDALYWSEKTAEERKNAIVKQLITLFGPEAGEPIHYFDKNWLEEPFSRGGYMAVMSPGIFWNASKILQKPVQRIYWAGTETSTEWYGYMEGALASAERVAQEVLQQFKSSKL